jgi:hypothetical protein
MKRAAKQTWGAMRTSEGALPQKNVFRRKVGTTDADIQHSGCSTVDSDRTAFAVA